MELVQNGGDVTADRSSCDDPGCSVLDQLELMEELVRETIEKGVAIIQEGSDEGVDQDYGAVRSE